MDSLLNKLIKLFNQKLSIELTEEELRTLAKFSELYIKMETLETLRLTKNLDFDKEIEKSRAKLISLLDETTLASLSEKEEISSLLGLLGISIDGSGKK